MDQALAPVAPAPELPKPAPRKFRPELQGLRALAAFLVVVYHVWLGRISGGVDIFFLISGFLITGQLFRAAERGRLEFRPMWGRMIKRLFPAALTVLAAVVVASMLLLPEYRWFQTVREVVASALYVENWRLAVDSVDYFAKHNTASLVQHFWSLSIQGQFYLVWPLLIGAVALVAARAKVRLWTALLITLLTAFTASLAYSVYLTAADQPLAYFHSGTRVWEFALGGLLALLIDRVALPKGLAVVVGWLGVIGVAVCGVVLQVGSVFPGYLALWPTLAAAMVLLAGATGSALGADRLLSSRPMIYLGNLSFSLYLWHWPVLVLYLVVRDRPSVGLLGGAFIIGLSLVLAALTFKFVEEPVRRSEIGTVKPWGAYRFGVVTLVAVLALAGGWQALGMYKVAKYDFGADDPFHPGGRALVDGTLKPSPKDVPLAPSLVALSEDWVGFDSEKECTTAARNPELLVCSTHEAKPVKRVVVIGDSHSEQFIGALRPIAEQRHWQLIAMLKGACPFSTGSESMPGDRGCLQWEQAAIDETIALAPDAVFGIGTKDVQAGRQEKTPPGYADAWRKVSTAGIPVVVMRDNPRFDDSPAECVEHNGAEAQECTATRAELYPAAPPWEDIDDLPDTVSFVDMADYFCDTTTCPAVIGNVIVYMDDNHVGATYMETIAPALGREIESLLGWRTPPAK